MKKKYLFGMALMASLAFNSCTKEVVIVQEGSDLEEVQQDGQYLTLQVSNGGDGLTTRAGRPLLSSQAKQDINTIVLYVVEGHNLDSEENASTGKNVVLRKTISADEWANALDYSTDGHGKQLQISFKGSENQKLDKGEYTIYAVGYKHDKFSCDTNYDITDDTKFGVSKKIDSEVIIRESNPTLAANDFSAVFASGRTTADEIFAGKVEVKVVTDDTNSYITTPDGTSKSDKATLVLNRQVAGVTGYFTNIPAKVGEYIPTHIRLVASGKSNKVHFTSMVDGETDAAATSGTSGVISIVNGSWNTAVGSQTPDAPYWANSGVTSKEDKGYIVYDIELSEFFPLIGKDKTTLNSGQYTFADMDLDGDGFVGYKDAQHYVYNYTQNQDNSSIFTDGNVTEDALDDWATAIQGGSQMINGASINCQTLSDFWINPNDYQTLVAGSVFAGEFIIPFLQNTTYNTFELQLICKEGGETYILKNWNVQVPNADMVSGGSADANIADGITGVFWTNDSKLKYNIYRNHLYSLGIKTVDSSDPTDPEKPDPKPDPDPDPDPDPEDKPEDLSKGQDLLINVNDNWEIIHDMVID